MEKVIGLVLSGAALIASSKLVGRSVARATEVPRTAQMLGSSASVEEWRQENRRALRIMFLVGTVLLLMGGALLVAELVG